MARFSSRFAKIQFPSSHIEYKFDILSFSSVYFHAWLVVIWLQQPWNAKVHCLFGFRSPPEKTHHNHSYNIYFSVVCIIWIEHGRDAHLRAPVCSREKLKRRAKVAHSLCSGARKITLLQKSTREASRKHYMIQNFSLVPFSGEKFASVFLTPICLCNSGREKLFPCGFNKRVKADERKRCIQINL